MAAGVLVQNALGALLSPGWSINEATGKVPAKPGLYAVHGNPEVWQELRLGVPPDGRPLYAGKAERSLASRDVKTHFSTGKTGSSTLRRSLAACLRHELALEACPRNITKPDGSANFGLLPDGDGRLTVWMASRLRLAAWAAPAGCALDDIETAVLQVLLPPLNIDKVSTPWRASVKSARAMLTAEARAWHPRK